MQVFARSFSFVYPHAMSEPIRLNIGGGKTQIPGYTNWDIKEGNKADKLDFLDGSVDAIYCSHTLEHFKFEDVRRVVSHWTRKLRPGGRIHIAVPDADVIEMARKETMGTGGLYQKWLFGAEIDEHDRHGTLFDRPLLTNLLNMCGFEAIEVFQPFVNDCSRIPVSLNLTAVKRPSFAISAKPRVMLCQSTGRCTLTATQTMVAQALSKTGYDVSWDGGVFWEKSLSHLFNKAIELGYDYVITIDHDGVFTPKDVQDMVELAQRNIELAAIFPIQMSRHENKPLVMNPHADYNGELTETVFGHFGLTIIRTEVLRKLPKPWIFSIPGPSGDWTTHPQSDSDITFWRNLNNAGFKVAQANRVILGHIVDSIRWPTKEGGVLQPLPNYLEKGRPENIVFDADAYRDKLMFKKPMEPNLPMVEAAKVPEGFDWISRHVHGWQCGEQGLLRAITRELEMKGYVVEVGAGDGIDLPVTAQYLIEDGWQFRLVEIEPRRVKSLMAKYPCADILDTPATPENIDQLCAGADVLVLDTDTDDATIIEVMQARPSIVMLEHHNLNDRRMRDKTFRAPKGIPIQDKGGNPIQTTFDQLDFIMAQKGYTPVARTVLNTIYAKYEIADKLKHEPSFPVGSGLVCRAVPNPNPALTFAYYTSPYLENGSNGAHNDADRPDTRASEGRAGVEGTVHGEGSGPAQVDAGDHRDQAQPAEHPAQLAESPSGD